MDIAALEERRRLFDNLAIDDQHAEWFRHRAWVRTIHGTTRIEGNSLNALEVEDVLLGRACSQVRCINYWSSQKFVRGCPVRRGQILLLEPCGHCLTG